MARRFRFNLEAVLRYREIMEDKTRREFAEANRRVEEERLRREEIGRERLEMQEEIVRSLEDQAPFQSIVATYHLVAHLDAAAGESAKRQQALEIEREKHRQALIVARQETSMMETLKERRREEFRREQDKAEQTLLDELSIQAQGRRRRETRRLNEGD